MSILDVLDSEREVRYGERFNGKFSTNRESMVTEFYDGYYNNNTNAKYNRMSTAIDDANKTFFRFDPETEDQFSDEIKQVRQEFRSLSLRANKGFNQTIKARELLKKYKELDPNAELPDIEGKALQIGKQASLDAQKAREGNQTLSGMAAGFVGSFGAAATDPVEIMASIVPVGKATTVLRAFATGAAENVALEALNTPNKRELRESIDEEFTTKDALRDIGISGVLGGTIQGGGKAVGTLRARKQAKAIAKKLADDLKHREALAQKQTGLAIRPESETEGAPRRVEAELVDDVADTGVAIAEDAIDAQSRDITNTIGLPELSDEAINNFDRPRLIKEYDEILRNPDTPIEVADAVRILRKQAEDLSNQPPGVTVRQHLAAISEIEGAMARGVHPDITRINKDFGFDEVKVREEPTPEPTPERMREVDPDDEFVEVEFDDATPEVVVKQSETRMKQSESPETKRVQEDQFRELARENPDEIFEVDGEDLTLRQVQELLDEKADLIKALEVCGI